MNSKKVFFILLGIFSLVLLGGSYGAYWLNSVLIHKSDELVALKLENYAQNLEEQHTRESLELIDKYNDVPELTRSIVPQDKDQARTILELSQIAEENGVVLNGFTFPGSSLGSTLPKPKTGSSSKTATAPESQLEAVAGLPGVFVMKVGTGSANSVSFPVLVNFLSALENNRRTAQVSNLRITPNPIDPSMVSFDIELTLYIKP